jgi:hypothetical protein
MVLPVLPEQLAMLTHSEATIFMAHRFNAPALGISGHNPQNLRHILAQLRRRRYELISIAELSGDCATARNSSAPWHSRSMTVTAMPDLLRRRFSPNSTVR